jgi:hypothetical protein
MMRDEAREKLELPKRFWFGRLPCCRRLSSASARLRWLGLIALGLPFRWALRSQGLEDKIKFGEVEPITIGEGLTGSRVAASLD